jgi:hypothetical protein
MSWLAYATLLAALIACYLTLLTWGRNTGVDFACFRAAAVVAMHGGNPYDFTQLWRAENALYNLPHHLVPGEPSYYYLDRYYNPPLFATLLRPLTPLNFELGFAIYGAAVIGLAAAGSWLLLESLGWTRYRLVAVALSLVSPCVFLAVWNGQQSTLLLFALGAALYALRRERPAIAGALMALGWVKPHLLLPIAVAIPLLLPSWRLALRWYVGFGLATLAGIGLTLVTTGAASIAAWLHTLFGYTGYADAIQNYMPSLSGMTLILLPQPWNRVGALALMAVGCCIMAATVAQVRRRDATPWAGIGLLVATWLVFAPFAHANDDVLLLLPLAVLWGQDAAGQRHPLPVVALWACTALPLAFLLPRPFSLLGLIPAALVFAATATRVIIERQPA